MSLKKFVVGIGEILMDVFEDGEAALGGAPFNVAFHSHQLLRALGMGEAAFVSAVGDDAWGRSIRATVEAAGMTSETLATVDRPTGTALVFESGGHAGFEIQQDVAWDFIRLDAGAGALASRCDAVVFGSLAQRGEVSRASIREFVSSVKGQRLYDVNLRRNTTNGVAGYSAEIIQESLKLATLVKLNDQELEEVCAMLGYKAESGDHDEQIRIFMERLRVDYSLTAVTVTRGAKGALLNGGGKLYSLPDSTLDQAQVHPVGAGDSFAAGLLFGLMQGWTYEESLELANILSSWVVQHASATPTLPGDVLAQIRGLVARVGKAS